MMDEYLQMCPKHDNLKYSDITCAIHTADFGGGAGACDGGVFTDTPSQGQTLRPAQPAGHQCAGAAAVLCLSAHLAQTDLIAIPRCMP